VLPGIHRNHFDTVEYQCGSNTTNGVRNIRHVGNTFVMKIWDIATGRKMANVHTDSTGTIILSGIMTHPGNFEDKDTGQK
jgi:hypothetical protein